MVKNYNCYINEIFFWVFRELKEEEEEMTMKCFIIAFLMVVLMLKLIECDADGNGRLKRFSCCTDASSSGCCCKYKGVKCYRRNGFGNGVCPDMENPDLECNGCEFGWKCYLLESNKLKTF